MALKSKAELQLLNNKLIDLGTEIGQLERDSNQLDLQIGIKKDEEQRHKEEINKKTLEITERDIMIGDKEKTIYQLKKKTQELEKFKFVLDYKIKELKRDIAPRS